MGRRRRRAGSWIDTLVLVLFLIFAAAAGTLALKTALTKNEIQAEEQGAAAGEDSGENNTEQEISDASADSEEDRTEPEISDKDPEWNLILVNQDHPIPENYDITLTLLSNGRQVDSRIYPELQQMFDDCRAAGYQLFVREGYRTHADQQQLMDEKVQAYRNEGYGQDEAESLAKQWVAVPGTSEHELGIAVDINADTSVSSSDAVYGWLEQNSYLYGFILRYPADKTEITGISNEPWHFRYVGKEAAQTIHEKGLCLEEYLGQN